MTLDLTWWAYILYIAFLVYAVVSTHVVNLGTLGLSLSEREIDPASLQPVLNEERGYYQLGPITDATQIFVLSVTIGFASNLAKVGRRYENKIMKMPSAKGNAPYIS